MNQDWEEQKLRELFHELKQEDERFAPSFARDWEAALSRLGKARSPRRLVRVATAAMMLILLIGSVAVFFSHPSRKPALTETPGSTIFLSQWRSPTNFLLQSPGEQLLKTVPHLGLSSVEIRAIMPDKMN